MCGWGRYHGCSLGHYYLCCCILVEVGCCGRCVLPFFCKWWVAPLSILNLLKVGKTQQVFIIMLFYLLYLCCYLNFLCYLWFIFCRLCNVQVILPYNFGNLHLTCGLFSDVCMICCCGKDLVWCHYTSSNWWVYHL